MWDTGQPPTSGADAVDPEHRATSELAAAPPQAQLLLDELLQGRHVQAWGERASSSRGGIVATVLLLKTITSHARPGALSSLGCEQVARLRQAGSALKAQAAQQLPFSAFTAELEGLGSPGQHPTFLLEVMQGYSDAARQADSTSRAAVQYRLAAQLLLASEPFKALQLAPPDGPLALVQLLRLAVEGCSAGSLQVRLWLAASSALDFPSQRGARPPESRVAAVQGQPALSAHVLLTHLFNLKVACTTAREVGACRCWHARRCHAG